MVMALQLQEKGLKLSSIVLLFTRGLICGAIFLKKGLHGLKFFKTKMISIGRPAKKPIYGIHDSDGIRLR